MPAALGLIIDQAWSTDIFGIAFFFLDEDFFMVSWLGGWPENGTKIKQSSKRDSAASRSRDWRRFTNEVAGNSGPCCRTGTQAPLSDAVIACHLSQTAQGCQKRARIESFFHV
jgi:hypothetical protein